ncbi:hypothetical protein PFISCL1PPCAC_14615, partial [Pristionchus fissidentatus]
SPCAKRFYPQFRANNFVCVCNSTYCDEYEDTHLSPGFAVLFSSSENGNRMRKSTFQLNERRHSFEDSGRIKFDLRVTYQSIIGFGGAFTDSAGINIMALSQSVRERLLETVFGRNGARYFIDRVPIASTDFSTSRYSYNDNSGNLNMSKFALAEEDTKFKIPLILRALNLTAGEFRLFSSPWSAPSWMKETGKMEGPGRLRKGMEKAWAHYFVRFFEEYFSYGISFWATTVQNEPTSGAFPFYGWQTMHWDATGERSFVSTHLGPLLAASKAAKEVKIIGLDDYRIWLPAWADEIYSDPAASKFIAGIGVHLYMDTLAPLSTLTTTHEKHPDKFILATEACAGFWPLDHGPKLGEWKRAEAYARNIIEDLNHFVIGWTDWNIAVDTQGGPSWARNFVDASIIVNETADEFLKQPIHYAMAHFSRFLRPNSTRIRSLTEEMDESTVLHTAFVYEGQRILTILNTLTVEQKITIEEETEISI